jgi:DNA-binding transcriptional MerR regulator
MQYREVVAHLVRFHQIDGDGLPAFKARIYILRKAGVPPIEKVGTGSRADYSLDDLTELHLALSMTEFGFSPARIAQIIEQLRQFKSHWPFTQYKEHDWLMISVRPTKGRISEADGAVAIHRVAPVPEAKLLENLQMWSFAGGVPTWNAVLNLGRVADNIKTVEQER